MTKLICPNHNDDNTTHYLTLGRTTAVCPDCGYTCPNFVAQPVRQVFNMRTGQTSLKNVLTGEVLDEG